MGASRATISTMRLVLVLAAALCVAAVTAEYSSVEEDVVPETSLVESATASVAGAAATSASRVVAWPKGLKHTPRSPKHTARPQGKLTRKPTNMQGKLANGGAFGDVLHTGTSPERLAERHTSTPRLPTSTGGSLPSSVPTSERRTSTAVAGLSTACVVGVAPVVTTRGVLLHA